MIRKYDLGNVEITKRSRLPHWNAEHAIYFVTFNLFDAFPAGAVETLRDACERLRLEVERVRGPMTHAERDELGRRYRLGLERILDEGHGSCFMNDPACASIVANALEFFDNDRYWLYAWYVMPNHVHVVLEPVPGHPLDKIIGSWKGFTNRKINSHLGRTGTVWQLDRFDRCIRDSGHLQRAINYVMSNPVKAELLEWPWARTYPDRIAAAL